MDYICEKTGTGTGTSLFVPNLIDRELGGKAMMWFSNAMHLSLKVELDEADELGRPGKLGSELEK